MGKLSRQISVVKKQMECIKNDLGETASTILISIKVSNVSKCFIYKYYYNCVIIIIENNIIIVMFF